MKPVKPAMSGSTADESTEEQRSLKVERHRWLRLVVQRSSEPDGATKVVRSLYCPKRCGATSVESCWDCGDRVAIEWRECVTALACDAEGQIPTEHQAANGAVYGSINRTTVADLMTHEVVCVTRAMAVEKLATLLSERSIDVAPVIDDAGELIGVITRADIMRVTKHKPPSAHPFSAAPFAVNRAMAHATDEAAHLIDDGYDGSVVRELLVGDIMTQRPISVPDNVLIERAAAMMAYEGVHHCGVIDGDGVLVGLLAALDIVRFVAQNAGYIVPKTTQKV